VAAALLHDLGMRHVPAYLAGNGDALDPKEVQELAAHPLLGAWHLSRVLGRHPAVDAALAQHWRGGRGYPTLPQRPSRAVDAVAVASAFAALTQARSFRSQPYDARGAADVLIAEATQARRRDRCASSSTRPVAAATSGPCAGRARPSMRRR
jgi:response regulator RpfG family c-di-GMP phosphodiesterase